MSCANVGLLPVLDGIPTHRSPIAVEPERLVEGLSEDEVPT